MPGVARQGDVVGGGIIADGAITVTAGGLPVATLGSVVTPHGKHSAATIANGSSTVFANGRPVARLGDVATCGDTIIASLPTITVG